MRMQDWAGISVLSLAVGLLLSAALPGSRPTPRERAPAAPAAAPDEDWLRTVREQIQRQEYHFSRRDDGSFSAPNRARDLRTRVTERGLELESRTQGRAAFGVELALARFGRGDALAEVAPGRLSARENRAEIAREALDAVEWFVNDERGLEHGWTIAEAPAHRDLLRAATEPAPLVLELAIEGNVRASLGDDATSIQFVDANGAEKLRYAQLVAVDDSGEILPARFAIERATAGPDTLRIEVADAGARYPITIDPIALIDSLIQSNSAGVSFGFAVAGAGDVNGDAYDDVVIGAPTWDYGLPETGAAFLYLGSPTGLPSSAAWSSFGVHQSAQYGFSVAGAGDVNRDGFDDLVIGEPFAASPLSQEGQISLFFGSPGGPPASGTVIEGNEQGARFGFSVAGAGDMNRDGFADVIVGAPKAPSSSVYPEACGMVAVYAGSPAGLIASPVWTDRVSYCGGDEGHRNDLGHAVAAAGDTNGDGYDDVIYGEPLSNPFSGGGYPLHLETGNALVKLGSPTFATGALIGFDDGDQALGHYGSSVAGVGDLNGDGYADIAVGAPDRDGDQVDEGIVYVHFGSPAGPNPVAGLTLQGNEVGSGFGRSVAGAGDMNGDGYDEVIVGKPYSDYAAADGGEARLYAGAVTGMSDLPSRWRYGGASANLGYSVAGVGDVNGDGLADAIAGMPGFESSPTQLNEGGAEFWLGSYPGVFGPGNAVIVGDVNGDGFADVALGHPDLDDGWHPLAGVVNLYAGSAAGISGVIWSGNGGQTASRFGTTVAAAGDVNGDGLADWLVGAPTHPSGGLGAGAAFLYLGSASTLAQEPVWSGSTNAAQDHYGSSLASAGDVNADGFDDWIVGAPGRDIGEVDAGGAWLYLGSATPAGTAPFWSASSYGAGEAFGTAVAGVGDVDADGFDDWIVGSPGRDTTAVDAGAAYLYRGPSGEQAWSAVPDVAQENARFGSAVAGAGDANGDGYADWLVGAPRLDPPGLLDAGRVYVYLGPHTVATPHSADGIEPGEQFGTSVASAGDRNGDGLSDVLAGAPYFGGTDIGRIAYFPSPSPFSFGALWTGRAGYPGQSLGDRLAAGGDVNGDGYADLLVYTPQDSESTLTLNAGASEVPNSTAFARLEGGQNGAALGYAVASAGDVNGDGYGDAIAGAVAYDSDAFASPGTNAGIARVYLGSASGLTPGFTQLESGESATYYGYAAAGAGDVNGDGYDDVIVGCYYCESGRGAAFVYLGSAGGIATTPQRRLAGTQVDSGFGCRVAGAGDVNHDGYDDVAVSACAYDGSQADEGAVFVYHGSATGTAASPWVAIEGDDVLVPGDTGNLRVAGAGDVNGDGYDDLLVGHPYADGHAGRFALHCGAAGGVGAVPCFSEVGTQAGSYFGMEVAAGDVSGDGLSDLVVAAPYFADPEANEGRVSVYLGSPTFPLASAAGVAGSLPGALLGDGLGTADVDDDGRTDVLIGAPGDGGGAVRVHRGSAAGLEGSYFAVLEESQPGAQLGSELAGADVNGDGFGDVVAGAPSFSNGESGEGAVLAFHGNTAERGLTASRPRLLRQRRGEGLAPVSLGGWTKEKAGFQLEMEAFSAGGRSRVRLQWEVKPRGVAFDGTGLQTSAIATDTGAVLGGQSAATLSEFVALPSRNTAYHYRVRVLSDDPLQPHSPWFSPAGNGANETDVWRRPSCGLGGELALLLPALRALRRRRSSSASLQVSRAG